MELVCLLVNYIPPGSVVSCSFGWLFSALVYSCHEFRLLLGRGTDVRVLLMMSHRPMDSEFVEHYLHGCLKGFARKRYCPEFSCRD
jgi:hypothetical protein